MATSRARSSAGRFFLLTFVLSWAVWIPLMLAHLGVLALDLPQTAITSLALPGVLMPAVAAVILTSRGPAKGGVRALLGRLLIWRVGWMWAVVVLMQPAILVLAWVLNNALGWSQPVSLTSPASIAAFLVTLVFLVIAATGEELGWRGYALPTLQAVNSPLVASAALGFAAATWHLPYWILQGTLRAYGLGYFVLNYVFVIALTIQLTWIYNRSRTSVLIPVVFHVVFNALNVALLPVTSSVAAFALLAAIEWAVALAMIPTLGALSSRLVVPDRRRTPSS